MMSYTANMGGGAEAGEMAWSVNVLTALTQDSGSVPSNHVMWLTPACTPALEDLISFSGLCERMLGAKGRSTQGDTAKL